MGTAKTTHPKTPVVTEVVLCTVCGGTQSLDGRLWAAAVLAVRCERTGHRCAPTIRPSP